MVKTFEDLERLMALMDRERIVRVKIDGLEVVRGEFTPKPKEQASEVAEEPMNPFGYADEDLFP